MHRMLLLPLMAGILFGCKTMSFDELKGAVLGLGKTESTQISDLSSLSDREVCSYALTIPSKPLGWERTPQWNSHVKEAIRRNLDVQRCADLTNRRTRVAAVASTPTATPPKPPAAPAQPPRKRIPQEIVTNVQRHLTDLGFDPGPIDGLTGRRTRSAVKSFQKSANLEVTGKISEDLLGHLRQEAAAAAATPAPISADPAEETATAVAAAVTVLQTAPSEQPVPASQEATEIADTPVVSEATEVEISVAAGTPIQDEGESSQVPTVETPPFEAAPAGEAEEVANLETVTMPPSPQPVPLAANGAKYHALIIGNNEYEHLPDLETALLDAQALAGLLRDDYGFNVKMLLNASRGDILRGFAEMRRTLSEEDSLLVYYGGHGVLDMAAERGYWLPVDAERDINTNWISNADVSDVLKATEALHVLIVADSCYSGTLVRAGAPPMGPQRRETLLKRLALKKSRTVMTSGGLEPVVDGGGGGHSVFANALLSVLGENQEMIEAQRVFAALRDKVVVNADQTPEYGNVHKAGHDGGDFIFTRK